MDPRVKVAEDLVAQRQNELKEAREKYLRKTSIPLMSDPKQDVKDAEALLKMAESARDEAHKRAQSDNLTTRPPPAPLDEQMKSVADDALEGAFGFAGSLIDGVKEMADSAVNSVPTSVEDITSLMPDFESVEVQEPDGVEKDPQVLGKHFCEEAQSLADQGDFDQAVKVWRRS